MKKHRNDIILIAVALLAAAALGIYTLATRSEGGVAVVTINGAEVMRLPLDEDTQVAFEDNGHTNTLVIENGKARMTQASCPDHVCIKQGEICYDGEMIVCIPNRTVVTVEGGAGRGLDAVAG